MRHKYSSDQTIRGHAFPEFIHNESYGKRKHYTPSSPGSGGKIRGFLLPVFLGMLLFLLCFRAFYLTVINGSEYRLLSDSNRMRTTIIHAPRGIIFDRNGKSLVLNTPGFRTVDKNKKVTILDTDTALSRIAQGDTRIEIDSLRQYPFKDAATHVIGFIGQITEAELKEKSEYQGNDLLGKDGLEQSYEATLKGIDGKELVEVNAMGKPVRKLGITDPIPGKDLTTTLDADVQKAAYDAMSKAPKGSVIATTPKGQIIALVSKPSFDPNMFTLGKSYKSGTTSGYQKVSDVLLDGETQPLLNRAIAGTYPPGSTFKLVTALSGLENNIIDKDFSIQDTGVLKVGTFSFGNWYYLQYGKTDGTVDVVKAIKRSNDIFFYTLAQKIGVDKLSETARQFGVGQVLGIDLIGEAKGLVPTQKWKEKVIKEPWYLGDTYHYGIGQGYLLTTPLQVNQWTMAIANGGTIYRPRLVEKNEDPIMGKVPISTASLDLIRQGMVESCAPGGVAWPLFKLKVKNEKLKIDGKNFLAVTSGTDSAGLKELNKYREIVVACKTGTAQHGDDKTLPHAWITLFAPAYNPEIVVTVLNESSGEGSNEAAPIAKKVLEAWFSKK